MTPSPVRVLLVEDDPVDVMHFQRLIGRHTVDLELEVATEGRAALERLNDGSMPRPHSVITDLEMPLMDGLELTRAIKGDATLANIVTIVFSASDDHGKVSEAYRAGAAGYVVKPDSPDRYREAVHQLFGYLKTCEFAS